MIDFQAIEDAKMRFLESESLRCQIADTYDWKNGRVSLWAGGMKNGPLGRWPTEQEFQDRLKELEEKLAKL